MNQAPRKPDHPGPSPRPVAGIFDSGLGGLAVVRELSLRKSSIPFVYIADQAHAPYGHRSLLELRRFSEGITEFLLEQHVRVVVIACNTASAAALYGLRELHPALSFVGMEPAVKPAAERTRTGKIGVIATKATFEGEPYAGVLKRFARDVEVFTRICPEFVRLVEDGEAESGKAREIVQDVIEPLLAQGVDQLALGCTHYTFLAPLIRRACDGRAQVIDPAAAVAKQLERVVAELDVDLPANPPGCGANGFFTTGEPARFAAAASRVLNAPVTARRLRWEPCKGFAHLYQE